MSFLLFATLEILNTTAIAFCLVYNTHLLPVIPTVLFSVTWYKKCRRPSSSLSLICTTFTLLVHTRGRFKHRSCICLTPYLLAAYLLTHLFMLHFSFAGVLNSFPLATSENYKKLFLEKTIFLQIAGVGFFVEFFGGFLVVVFFFF